jgi:ABC-2 type transport system permease protein
MKHIWSIAAKELRGYFNSAIALIFLATFLAVVLYAFFFVDRFFARNLADVRPLFEWLPLLLIFLVSALTMRLWSEEQKTGTLEILLTLPVPIYRLVLGKFLAGLILVAIALVLTLGLPITVSLIADLDWGPVMGGYVAALLLASTYLAVGLCVSSMTENQIVALIVTVVVCTLLYLPGTSAITSLVGADTAEFLRMLGTGSRFESIARGVLDLRDLAYYASLVAFFLALNTVLLEAKGWGAGQRTRTKRMNAGLMIALMALNALALNVWLKPVDATRIDLTAGGIYSLSDTTGGMLGSLEEPLTIRGFFSDRSHEMLQPLVPQIKDILAEYKVEGRGKVRLSFVDPSQDEDIEQEINERYSIRSLPVQSFSRHEKSLINAYFHVLVSYGDQHEVLSFEDLAEVEYDGEGNPRVRLGNIEYEITKAIRKVVYGFQSLHSVFATLASDVTLHAYISRDELPGPLLSLADTFDKVVREIEAQSGGKLKYVPASPATEEERVALNRQYGIQPIPIMKGTGMAHIYFHAFVRIGDRAAFVEFPFEATQVVESQVREAVTTAIKRATPGFIRTVGMVVPEPGKSEATAHMPEHEAPAPQRFTALYELLKGSYSVRTVDLRQGDVGDDIDVLIVAGPEDVLPGAKRRLDQFLMRGGSLIVLAGIHRPRPGFWTNPMAEMLNTGMDSLLDHYGVKLSDKLVMDTSSDEALMKTGLRVAQLRYPAFVRVPSSQMGESGVIASGVDSVSLHMVTPAYAKPPTEGEDAPETSSRVLMWSSGESWLHPYRDVRPDLVQYPGVGFARPDALSEDMRGPFPLAVAVTGTFTSAFAKEGEEVWGSVLTRSPPDTRLVLVGSSAFVSDEILSMASQMNPRTAEINMRFVHNLVDWALEDTDLLKIRASRTAANLDVDSGARWEWLNYGIAFFGLVLIIGLSWVMPKPSIDLREARRQAGRASPVAAPAASQGEDEDQDEDDDAADNEDDDEDDDDDAADNDEEDDDDDDDDDEPKGKGSDDKEAV